MFRALVIVGTISFLLSLFLVGAVMRFGLPWAEAVDKIFIAAVFLGICFILASLYGRQSTHPKSLMKRYQKRYIAVVLLLVWLEAGVFLITQRREVNPVLSGVLLVLIPFIYCVFTFGFVREFLGAVENYHRFLDSSYE